MTQDIDYIAAAYPTHLTLLRLVLLAGLAPACGPKSAETDSEATTASTATTASSATTGTTAQATTGASEPTGTGVTGGPPPDPCALEPDPGGCDAAFPSWAFDPATQRCYEWYYGGCDGVVPFGDATECQSQCEPCEAFAGDTTPAPTHPPSTITVRNDSAQPIFLQTFTPSADALGFRGQSFAVRRFGASEVLVTAPNACDFPCASFDNRGCGAGCGDGGPPPPPLLIAPGGAFTREWNGLHFAQVDLPSRCLPAACVEELTCGRWTEAWSGQYEAIAVVAPSWDCAPDCTCTPNAEGWCELGPGPLGDPIDPQELTGLLYFPGSSAELVFE